jgi:hypothetical protein
LTPRRAAAYLFADDIRLHSEIHTPYGSFAAPPWQRVPRSAGAEAIAQAVRAALEHWRDQREMPSGGKERVKIFLAGMGVKSNAQLQQQARNVDIEVAGDLSFHPTHNGGTSGDGKGFRPIPGQEPVRIAINAPPAEVAAALLRAFDLCTSIYT